MAWVNMAQLANVSLITLRISRDMWISPYVTEQGPEVSRIRHKAIRGDLSDASPESIPYRQADRLNAARTV